MFLNLAGAIVENLLEEIAPLRHCGILTTSEKSNKYNFFLFGVDLPKP